MIDRRSLIAALPVLVAGPALAAAPAPPVVTMLGDSITAGYGLRAADALPAQLDLALKAMGVQVTMRPAGVSGDTTAGGLARLNFSVQADTALCVVELGGNDLRMHYPPAVTQGNLDKIVKRLKAKAITVVLCGGRGPSETLGDYGREFDAVFAAVAKANDIALADDLLGGVLEQPDMKQADGIHPNIPGVKILAARLAPVVAKALAGRKG